MENKDKKQCPLCGKPIDGDDLLCDDCRHSADNQYESDIFDHSKIDSSRDEKQLDNGKQILIKKKKSKSILLFIIICIVVTIFGIVASLNVINLRKDKVAEDYYWEKCIETDTQLAYSKYLVAYPNGKYVDDANSRILMMHNDAYKTWVNLKNSGSLNDLFMYIKNNPNSLYIDSAKMMTDSISWYNALNLGTKEAIALYLSSINLGVVNGAYKKIALDRIDYLSSIKPIDSQQKDSIVSILESLYKVLNEKDSVLFSQMVSPQVIFNNDSLSSIDLFNLMLSRHVIKDSTVTYTPVLSTIDGLVDRDTTFSIKYIEQKIVENKRLKKKSKIVQKISTDTVSITIQNFKRINQISIN